MKRKKPCFDFKLSLMIVTLLIGFMCVPGFGQLPDKPILDGRLDDVYKSHGWIVDWDAYDGSAPTDPDPGAPDARVYILSNHDIDPDYIWVVWVISRNLNDNSYGINKHNSWEKGHNFKDLLESDMQRLAISNKCRVTVLDAEMDLLDYHATYDTPSGYDVGMDAAESIKHYINGGDWSTAKFDYKTSLSSNLNDFGYCTGAKTCSCGGVDLIADSPPWLNESTFTPAASCSDWEYTIMWELRILRTVFATDGCPAPQNDIDWPWVKPIELHASPSKTVMRPPTRHLPLSIGNYVWQDINRNGKPDVTEPGIPNVTVELYSDADGDGNYSSDGMLLDTQTTDADGYYMFHQPGSRNLVVKVTDTNHMLTGYSLTTGSSSTLALSESLVQSGTIYLGANFGYAHTDITKTVIGDYVWSDADGDGIQDPGEPGIGGVPVKLLIDFNGDNYWDPDDANEIKASTITTDDGYYHFINVEPGKYKIYIDESGVLSGYTRTSGPYCSVSEGEVILVEAGDKYVCADYGFINPNSLGIGNQVWQEANANGLFEAGEEGIEDVTLVLVKDTDGNQLWDTGERIIAATTTDKDGNYSFSGLPPGHYLVHVTDMHNVLRHCIKCCGPNACSDGNSQEDPYAVSLTSSEPGNGNYTADFGYRVDQDSGMVGDRVWYDLDGDGEHVDGEEGSAGVVLELWKKQGSNFVDTALRTTTDARGVYFFTQLDIGGGGKTYQVRVAGSNFTTGPLQGMTRTNPDPALGNQDWEQSDNLTSTQPHDLSLDFGYHFNPSGGTYYIGGVVWADSDEDGYRYGEEGIPDVTLALYRDGDGDGVIDPGESLLAAAFTGPNGDYRFTGLAAGDYIVTITDDLNMLEGSKQTFNYPQTPPPSPPFSTIAAVTVGPDIANVDFGFNPFCIYTLASLSFFRTYSDNGQVVVHWETTSEIGTAGFYLFRQDKASNRFQQLNKEFLPGLLHFHQGGVYRYVDQGAFAGETYTYRLVEVEFNGDRHNHGPFTVTVGDPPGEIDLEPMPGIYSKKPHKISPARHAARLRARQADMQTARVQENSRVGNEVKMVVKKKGLYYLDAASIANMLGLSLSQAEQRIRNHQFSLDNWGREIAYLPAGGSAGIYFYGEGIDSLYTDENLYWLRKGTGSAMESVPGGLPSPGSGQETFTDTLHLEEDHYALTALFTDPGSDYWMWDYIIAGSGGKTFNFYAPDAAASGTASLTVYLKGSTDTSANPDHHVSASLNGTWIGESQWNGRSPHQFTVPFAQSLIMDGPNTIEITGILPGGVPYSIFYVDAFDLDYRRYYRAVNDGLICSGDENQVVTITGFTGPDIRVFDVTDPLRPKFVTGTTIDLTGTYRVSFKPSSPASMYAAVTAAGAPAPFSAFANKASALKNRENKADYVVIVPQGLEEVARNLTALRQAKGMDAIVVELEDIYDEFNYGSPSPEAIKDFLTYAYHNWNKNGPQYVVLAGEGTFDYKNCQGYCDNLVPPMLVNTAYGLFASDTWFADVSGNDGVPEMAIGRLPVMSAAELQVYIDKLSAYEYSGGEWTNKVLMLADNPDSAGQFPQDSSYLATLFTGYTVEKIHLPDFPTVEQARQKLLEGFNNGAVLINYIGHAGLDSLAMEKLLWSGDVPSLQNEDRLPIMTAMTCIVGRFALPGFDSLSEELVLKSNGGVVAMWSPTGLSLNYLARRLAEKFFKAAFQAQEKTIGKAMLKAMADYAAANDQPFMLYIYSLLGDPALEIK